MEDQKRSSMLLFLSKYTIKKEDSENLKKDENHIIIENNEDYDSYIIDNDNNKLAFSGCHTNDAPARFLLKLAEHNEEPIDKIFCIVSKDVYNIKLPQLENESSKLELEKGKTAFDRFSALIRNEVGPSIEIIPIYYDFDPNNEDFDPKDKPTYIYNQIKTSDIGKLIYIDYTGGLRDSSLFMIALIRYLEFKGIVCKDIIYSDFFSKPKAIRNIRYIYDMFNMINGVSEFVGTGNARQLVDLQKKLENTTNNDNVNNFVSSLQSFSDAIALCNVGSIVDAINSISESINTLEQDISDDIFVQMFKTLIPTVKEKLYIGKEPPSILDLSQWCLDNNMLQQAVTIYNEKILSYYILNNYDDFKNELKKPIPKYRSYRDIHEKYKNLSKIWDEFNDSDGKRNKYKKKISYYIDCEISNVQNKCKGFEVDEIEDYSIIVYKAFKTIKNQYTHEKKDELSKDILHKATNFQDFMTSFMNNEDIFVKCVKDKITKDIKPIFSLQELETSNPKLWQAMKYYHAVKILRNNINHVSGDVGGMNAKMQEYLEEKGLGDIAIAASETFKFKLESKFISDTLEAAIEFSKEICKN
jgi:CRISPR-associated protein (cas_TM1812)